VFFLLVFVVVVLVLLCFLFICGILLVVVFVIMVWWSGCWVVCKDGMLVCVSDFEVGIVFIVYFEGYIEDGDVLVLFMCVDLVDLWLSDEW